MPEFHGHLSLLAAVRNHGRTVLARQSFRAPFHLSKPYWDADSRALLVQVVNPTAGILAGGLSALLTQAVYASEDFFARLRKAGVKRLVDVRLNNTGQLAGFTKRDDLRFFTKEILAADYVHLPILAPTQEMLEEYKKEKRGWQVYEKNFLRLMKEREIEKNVEREVLEDARTCSRMFS